jgi:hypothetical protein
VRADGRFRHLGKAGVASGANDGAIGAADVVVEGQDELGHAGGIGFFFFFGACNTYKSQDTLLYFINTHSPTLPPAPPEFGSSGCAVHCLLLLSEPWAVHRRP